MAHRPLVQISMPLCYPGIDRSDSGDVAVFRRQVRARVEMAFSLDHAPPAAGFRPGRSGVCRMHTNVLTVSCRPDEFPSDQIGPVRVGHIASHNARGVHRQPESECPGSLRRSGRSTASREGPTRFSEVSDCNASVRIRHSGDRNPGLSKHSVPRNRRKCATGRRRFVTYCICTVFL